MAKAIIETEIQQHTTSDLVSIEKRLDDLEATLDKVYKILLVIYNAKLKS